MKFKKALTALLAGVLLGASATVTVSALEPHGTGIKMRKWLTNDPNYQFSEAYKTSVWYENFSALTLGRNDRNNVLNIAISQLGYHEGDSSADFHGRNTSGTGNYIEYARLLTPNFNDNSYDWCACFVNWCLNQARFDQASSEIGCQNWINELKTLNMWQNSAAYKGTYTPKPADMIFFDWDANGKWSDHIGLVLYTTDTHVYTIEGNSKNNDVGVRSYPLNDPRVLGYGTPPYDEGNVATIDHSYKNGMPRGIYVVGNSAANPTGGNTVPLGSRVSLVEVVGDSARVIYKDQSYSVAKDCLYLMYEDFVLTYDANGGQTAPDADYIHRGQSSVVTDAAPVKEGDTFLGWSRVPYNVKVDFKPGETITLTKDTTLYAVWEIHSKELAAQAAAEGLLPAYEHPDSIQNSHAILLGTLNSVDIFTDLGDTEVMILDDTAASKVLAFSSTGQSNDPYVTIPYKDICRSLSLAPVTGEETAYIILRVKNQSMSNTAVELSFNGQENTRANLLAIQSGWQYLVFDLSFRGFRGELDTLRIDWEKTAEASGETMLISDIYFAPSKTIRDAILDDEYVFPVQELVEIPPSPETDETAPPADEPVTEPVSKPADDPVHEPPTTTPNETTTEPSRPVDTDNTTVTEAATVSADTDSEDNRDAGCASALGSAVWAGMIALAGGFLFSRKKKE